MSKFQKAFIDGLERWRDHPANMVRELFGVEPDAWQAEILEAFPHNQRMAMVACRGPGKTTVLAWIAWNFLLTRKDANIAATSVSGDNLRDGLLKEMSLWYAKSRVLQSFFQITTTRIFNKQAQNTWWLSFRTWPRTGDTNAQAQTLAGLHAKFILFILDESSDIPDTVMVAAEAALSGCEEGHVIQAGNPTKLEGPLYRASRNRSNGEACGTKLWYVVNITGDPDDPMRSPRVPVQWARDQIAQWGASDPWTIANVFGRFPPGSINTLISEEEVRAAMKRYYRMHEIGDVAKILGIDVARQGLDLSVICPRQGIQCFPLRRFRGVENGIIGASHTNMVWNEFDADGCFIDASGGLGFTWIDQLQTLGRQPIPVQFAGKASQDERFVNRRAEMFWRAAQWIKGGGALPPEDSDGAHELLEGLSKTTYFHKNDRIQIEDKDQIKVRIGRSPDEADAFALTFADNIAPRQRTRALSYSAVRQEWNPFASTGEQQPRNTAATAWNPFASR